MREVLFMYIFEFLVFNFCTNGPNANFWFLITVKTELRHIFGEERNETKHIW